MLAMVLLLIGGFLALVWRSYRVEAGRAARGETFEPDGKLRWNRASRTRT